MYGKTKELKVGDVVERHLMDDDIVLFNRQPSLHRMSIMAHKVQVHQHRTFRFNECVCSPYNADFDGDEMNIHLPQTYEARAEAAELMGIKNNICTARNGEPLISCTQDFITGAFLLTGKDVFFTRDRFAQICAYIADGIPSRIDSSPSIMSPVELFTGKQLFEVAISYALSKCTSKTMVNLIAKNRGFKGVYDTNDGLVQIINNKFIMGRLDKAIIGGENRKGSLVYQLLAISKTFKTAETGYMQRRLMKALEDFSLKYDYTVRNSMEDLVQFRYGEDSVQTLRNEEEQFFDWIYIHVICVQVYVSRQKG